MTLLDCKRFVFKKYVIGIDLNDII